MLRKSCLARQRFGLAWPALANHHCNDVVFRTFSHWIVDQEQEDEKDPEGSNEAVQLEFPSRVVRRFSAKNL